MLVHIQHNMYISTFLFSVNNIFCSARDSNELFSVNNIFCPARDSNEFYMTAIHQKKKKNPKAFLKINYLIFDLYEYGKSGISVR